MYSILACAVFVEKNRVVSGYGTEYNFIISGYTLGVYIKLIMTFSVKKFFIKYLVAQIVRKKFVCDE